MTRLVKSTEIIVSQYSAGRWKRLARRERDAMRGEELTTIGFGQLEGGKESISEVLN